MGYVSSKSLRDSGSSVYVEIFTDGVDYTSGTTTQLTASNPLPAANAVWVYFDGVVQHHSEYGVSGYTITFNAAIPADTANVEVQFNKEVNVGIPGQNTITHSMMTSDNISTLLRKNVIINGGFDIWQRATSQTSSSYGSDDRWINDNTGTTKTHSRQTFTLGQTDVPNNPRYYSRTAVTSSAGASNFCNKNTRIEKVSTFAGQNATLSFWAKADAAKNIAIEFAQYFGTGGSPSSIVTGIGAQHVALTTTWAKYEITVAIPSISGKTLGTNNDDWLSVLFWFDAGTNFDSRTNSLGQQSGTFDIAQVQLEAGSDATDFEQRHIADELTLCQRYYCKSYDLTDDPGTVTNAAAVVVEGGSTGSNRPLVSWEFPVRMRINPSVVYYSPVTGTAGKIRDYNASVDNNCTTLWKGQTGVASYNATTGVVGNQYGVHITADAEL